MHLPGKNNLLKSVFFGGTFDPIHNGHLEIISYIKNNFNFNKMFLSPAGNQYMKSMPPIATPEQRYEMCRLAFHDDFITLVGNYIFTTIGKIFFGLKISDILYTYVVGKTKLIKDLKLKSGDFKFCIELPIKVKRNKLKYASYPCYERSRIG